MDILGEGAGLSSFTVRERGEKGTHVRDPRNMTLKHTCIISCADPGIFDRGGSRLRRFLVLSLFYRGGGAMVLLQRKLYFPKDPEGVQHFQGRSIQGGIQMLIAITITCDF